MSSGHIPTPVHILLLFTFILSGAAGMVHELSWSRQLGLLLGQTSDAATLVLVAYFTGMALGSFLAPAITGRGLMAYGLSEIGIGLWALLFPVLESRVGALEAGGVTRAALVLPMLPATICMGMTLPSFIGTFEAPRTGLRSPGLAYGLNTLGSLIGIAASVGGMFVVIGVSRSSQVMGLSQIVCGLLVLALRTARSDRRYFNTGYPDGHLALLAFLAGFSTLSFELLHLHLYSFIFHNSTFSFALALGAVILGLAAGPLVLSLLESRLDLRWILRAGAAAVPLLATSLVTAFLLSTDLRRFEHGQGFAEYLVGAAQVVTLFTTPLFFALGLTLPVSWGLSTDSGQPPDRQVGLLTGASCMGAAIGAWLMNFHLLPGLGVAGSLAALTTMTALSMLSAGLSSRRSGSILILSLIACAWIARHLHGRSPGSGLELVERRESAYGWIDLNRRPARPDFMEIRQNVHYVLGNTAAHRSEERQGNIPLLVHPRPRNALLIGLGTGLTALSTVRHPELEESTIVELIPDVVRAARQIGALVRPLFEDPRGRILSADGRHHLRRCHDRYDLILSDLFVPWESRTGYLYTREFYDLTRARLAPGGLFCQWLPLYQLGEKELTIILDTFATVFPVTTLWWCQIDSRYPILGMMGSEANLLVDGELLEIRLAHLRFQGIQDPWISSSSRFLDLFAGRWIAREATPLNTDEHPLLEFSAPVSERDGSLMVEEKLRAFFESTLARLPPSGILSRAAPGQSLSTMAERLNIVRRRLEKQDAASVGSAGGSIGPAGR